MRSADWRTTAEIRRLNIDGAARGRRGMTTDRQAGRFNVYFFVGVMPFARFRACNSTGCVQ